MEILILKSILLAFLITQFEPIQWILDMLPNNLFTAIITTLLTCLKCVSFWVGLIIGGFWIGCTAFIIGFVIDKILMRVNKISLK
jgi:hypothetical protein